MAGPRTHPDVLKAVDLVRDGYPIGEVARIMQVHRTTIKRAIDRETKKGLDKVKVRTHNANKGN